MALNAASRSVRSVRPPLPFASLLSVLAVPAAYLYYSLAPTVNLSIVISVIAVASLIFGTSVFLKDGGMLVTVAGTFCLFVSTFSGLATLSILVSRHSATGIYLMHALSIVHLSTIATWWIVLVGRQRWQGRLSSRNDPERRAEERASGNDAAGDLPYAHVVAFGLVLVAAAAPRALPASSRLAESGILLLAIGFAISAARFRRPALSFAGIAFLSGWYVYLSVVFGIGGRLLIFGLAVATLYVLNQVYATRRLKLVLVVSLVPALIIGGFHRAEHRMLEEVSGAEVILDGLGLGSFQAPVVTFAELIERERMAQGFPRQNGRSFATAAVFWVPRAVWPNKPLGLGAQLAEELRPMHRSIGATEGHSMAALMVGEWFVNFGWLGIAFMIPVHAVALTGLDRLRLSVLRDGKLSSTRRVLVVATVAVSLASLAHYVWAGSFTAAARGVPLFLVVALALIAARRRALRANGDRMVGAIPTQSRVGRVPMS